MSSSAMSVPTGKVSELHTVSWMVVSQEPREKPSILESAMVLPILEEPLAT